MVAIRCVLCSYCPYGRFARRTDPEKKKQEKESSIALIMVEILAEKYDKFYTKIFEFQLLRV